MCPESLGGRSRRRVRNPTHTEVSVARQSPQRPDADEPELDATDGPVEPEVERGEVDRALWDELRIDPVEIALPAGTGFTLRAYRSARELTPTDVAERDQDDPFLARRQVVETEDAEEVVILDEQFAALPAREHEQPEGRRRKADADGDEDESDDEAEDDE